MPHECPGQLMIGTNPQLVNYWSASTLSHLWLNQPLQLSNLIWSVQMAGFSRYQHRVNTYFFDFFRRYINSATTPTEVYELCLKFYLGRFEYAG